MSRRMFAIQPDPGKAERLQSQLVNRSLGILARVRRRQQAGVLLDHLATIRTPSRTRTRLEELTRAEEWPAAISLLL